MAPVAFFNSLYRSVKPGAPFWVMEAGIGGGYYPGVPHNRRFRPVMWHHYANGAEMALVFLWRPSPSGYEQDHAAILDHAGRSRRTYRDLQACMLEFERLQPVLEALPPPRADVALVLDYDALWRNNAGHTASPYEYEAGYVGGLHAALFRRHQLGDVIPADRPLDGYKLVILPSLGHVERTFADRLAAYVAGGGVVLALGELGNVGPNAEFLNAPGPEHLGALFGLSLEGRLNLSAGGAAGFEGALDGRPVSGLASRWIGDVDLKGGAALLRFREGTYQDQPALVEKAAGKGAALYLAARQVDEASLGVILDYACRSWRSRADADLPARVERVVRGGVTFLINHSPEPADIPLGFDGRALVGTCTDGVARLAPYDVCAVEQAPAARPRRKRA